MNIDWCHTRLMDCGRSTGGCDMLGPFSPFRSDCSGMAINKEEAGELHSCVLAIRSK